MLGNGTTVTSGSGYHTMIASSGGFSDWTGLWIEFGLIVAYFAFSAVMILVGTNAEEGNLDDF